METDSNEKNTGSLTLVKMTFSNGYRTLYRAQVDRSGLSSWRSSENWPRTGVLLSWNMLWGGFRLSFTLFHPETIKCKSSKGTLASAPLRLWHFWLTGCNLIWNNFTNFSNQTVSQFLTKYTKDWNCSGKGFKVSSMTCPGNRVPLLQDLLTTVTKVTQTPKFSFLFLL